MKSLYITKDGKQFTNREEAKVHELKLLSISKKEIEAIKKNIANNVKRARQSIGLSQQDIATILGFDSGTTISFIEGGEERYISRKLVYHIKNKQLST